MPRAPVLPVLDWRAILDSGKTFEEWLDAAEHDMNRKAVERGLAHLQATQAPEGCWHAHVGFKLNERYSRADYFALVEELTKVLRLPTP